MDIAQELADKENEITKAEELLGLIEDESSRIARTITEWRMDIDLKRIEVRKLEQKAEEQMPAIRMGKRNISRMRREYENLKRQYFRKV